MMLNEEWLDKIDLKLEHIDEGIRMEQVDALEEWMRGVPPHSIIGGVMKQLRAEAKRSYSPGDLIALLPLDADKDEEPIIHLLLQWEEHLDQWKSLVGGNVGRLTVRDMCLNNHWRL